MKKVLFLFILLSSLFGCAIEGFEIPTVVIPDVDLNPETDTETPTEESYIITYDYVEGVTAIFEQIEEEKNRGNWSKRCPFNFVVILLV